VWVIAAGALLLLILLPLGYLAAFFVELFAALLRLGNFDRITLNQIRMVLRLAAAYGEEIDRERAVELLAVVGAGLGFRALARQALTLVPGPGWAVKGGVAYAATLTLGQAAIAYFEGGGQTRVRRTIGSVRSRS